MLNKLSLKQAIRLLDKNEISSYELVKDCLQASNQLDKKLSLFQLKVSFDNAANSPIRFIHIYYEPSENYVSK